MKRLLLPARRWFSTGQAPLRVAVVGTGRMGEIRLAGLQRLAPKLEIAAIIDASLTQNAAASARLARQYNAPCFGSMDAAAPQLETVDGLWIATPTPTHLKIVQDALRLAPTRLRAVGIEKPVAGTLGEIDAAYNACSKQRVHLVCSFQRRFDPSYQALRRQCINENSIGAIKSIHTVFRDHPCPPIEFLKTGGDPFHDLAVHDIDYVCSLLGEYPTRVYAHGSSCSQELREVGVMDQASVWLEFPSGAVCTMDVSRRADYGYDQRIEVAGERGMLQVLNPPTTTLVHSGAAGVQHDVAVHSFPERFHEAYALELGHFVDVMERRQPPVVHWNAARMATIIAEAARLAAVKKKIVTIKYDKTRQDHPNQDPYVDVEYEY